ncbi:MAG TPA: hypothetical protein PLS69_14135 [Terricaulis sp.]|nr:hypothetical protein [Terricaulis sp.]
MSLAATIRAYAAKIDPVAKLAFIELADWADDLGRAPVVISHIAEFAGCTDIDAERAVERLIKAGFVSELPNDGRGRRFVLFTEVY